MNTLTMDDLDVRTRVKIENRAKRAKKTPAEMAAFLLDQRVGVTPRPIRRATRRTNRNA